MITKPTVLILGAGASADYRFPLGRDLLVRICAGIRSGAPINQQLLAFGFSPIEIQEFCNALDFSGQPSVDAFLEFRETFIKIGKAAIACALIPHEDSQSFIRTDIRGGWYEYLWQQLRTAKAKFCENKLSIITFNYDRSLEFYLSTVLHHSYGIPAAELSDMLQHVPIVHVHGQLGEFSPIPEVGRRYEPLVDAGTIRTCVENIKIVHETSSDTPELNRALQLLVDAKAVCFLGFGYLEQNMTRLRLDQINWAKKKTYCCFYGLTKLEQLRIRDRWGATIDPNGTWAGGDSDQDILRFLRERVELK